MDKLVPGKLEKYNWFKVNSNQCYRIRNLKFARNLKFTTYTGGNLEEKVMYCLNIGISLFRKP